MLLTALTLLITLLYPLSVTAYEKPCTYHDSNGKFYDLNPLKSPTDYTFTMPQGHEFILNVCKTVSHETWNLKVEDPENVAGFIRKAHGDFSVG